MALEEMSSTYLPRKNFTIDHYGNAKSAHLPLDSYDPECVA